MLKKEKILKIIQSKLEITPANFNYENTENTLKYHQNISSKVKRSTYPNKVKNLIITKLENIIISVIEKAFLSQSKFNQATYKKIKELEEKLNQINQK